MRKILSIVLALVMLAGLTVTGASAAETVIDIQISAGVPTASSGEGWEYVAETGTLYLYSGGSFAFKGDEVTCRIESNSVITEGVFLGTVYSFGGKIAGGTYKGEVKLRFSQVTGGLFLGTIDRLGGTITGGVFSPHIQLAETLYSVIILDGKIKGTDLIEAKVIKGTTVHIVADNSNDQFAGWTSFSTAVNVSFADAKSAETSFVMPEGNVNIIATRSNNDFDDTDPDDNNDDVIEDIVPSESVNAAITRILGGLFNFLKNVIAAILSIL